MEREDRALEPGLFADGDEVRTADDEVLGQVVGFWPSRDEPTHLIVAHGAEATGWYVPTSAISGFQPGQLFLAQTLDEIRAAGWQTPPDGAPPATGVSAN